MFEEKETHLAELIGLSNHFQSYSKQIKADILTFYKLVWDENQVQNLTRLIEPLDFYYGHLLDCLEAANEGWVSDKNIDLGSGAGVPGLVCALLVPNSHWILVESEGMKAEFLQKAVISLRLEDRVRVFSGRIEKMPNQDLAGRSIFSRAVGKIGKIYSWVEKCSTWNNIVLFKGPSWSEEWSEWEQSRKKNPLLIYKTHGYSSQEKSRILVDLRKK